MSKLQEAYIDIVEDMNHNIRAPYDRSKGQINNILELCEKIKEKTGKEIIFDNTWSNHYTLIVDDNKYDFNIYKDVINALTILLTFI